MKILINNKTFIVNPNPSIVASIKEATMKTGGYCPCRLEHNVDTMCMCKDFIENGNCVCRLFVEEKMDEKTNS